MSADVRRDIWYKLWGNMTINPVSAITGAPTDRVLDDPLVLAFCSAAMREASAVGAQIGCAIEQQPEDRHAMTRKLGSFKPSMLQDVEAGRTLELDAHRRRGARDRAAGRRGHAEHRRAARPHAAVRAHARAVPSVVQRLPFHRHCDKGTVVPTTARPARRRPKRLEPG